MAVYKNKNDDTIFYGGEFKLKISMDGYSELCRAVVNLGDLSHITEHPTVGTTQYADGL